MLVRDLGRELAHELMMSVTHDARVERGMPFCSSIVSGLLRASATARFAERSIIFSRASTAGRGSRASCAWPLEDQIADLRRGGIPHGELGQAREDGGLDGRHVDEVLESAETLPRRFSNLGVLEADGHVLIPRRDASGACAQSGSVRERV
jgi:hypothetical protein